MKTTVAQTKERILLFSTAAIATCLLSIMVLRASERESAGQIISPYQLSLIDQAVPEASLEVEDWMLNFKND
jgi:hypothetical protein